MNQKMEEDAKQEQPGTASPEDAPALQEAPASPQDSLSEEEDAGKKDDQSDEDFQASEEEGDSEDSEDSRGARKRGRRGSSDEEDDSEDSDDDSEGGGRRKKKKFRQGERASARVKAIEVKKAEEKIKARTRGAAVVVAQPKSKPKAPAGGAAQQKKQGGQGGSKGGSSSGGSDEDDEEGDSDEEDEESSEPEPEPPLERTITEAQATADTALIKQMPELYLALDFLFLFRGTLELSCLLTFDSLVDALVRSPGDSGLLAELHTELLQGIVSSKKLSPHNWAHYLAQRLTYEWSVLSRSQGKPPFAPEKKGEEAAAYAALSAVDRVVTLKVLCDLRAEMDDIREEVEEAIARSAPPGKGKAGSKDKDKEKQAASKPPLPAGGRVSRAAAAAAAASGKRVTGPAPLTVQDMQREPLGTDAAGNAYWWFDWCEAHLEGGINYGSVLVREGPSSVPKGAAAAPASREGSAAPSREASTGPSSSKGSKGGKAAAAAAAAEGGKKKGAKGKAGAGEDKKEKKGGKKSKVPFYLTYQLPAEAAPGKWEYVGSSIEELEAFGAKLGRSIKKADKAVAEKVNGVLVPDLKARVEEQEKWKRARERTAKQLGGLWAAAGGMIVDRSSRAARKAAVNYSDDKYDKMMKDAIRAGKSWDDDNGSAAPARAKGGSGGGAAPPSREGSLPAGDTGAGRRGRSRGSETELVMLDREPRFSKPRLARQEEEEQEEQEQEEQQEDGEGAGGAAAGDDKQGMAGGKEEDEAGAGQGQEQAAGVSTRQEDAGEEEDVELRDVEDEEAAEAAAQKGEQPQPMEMGA